MKRLLQTLFVVVAAAAIGAAQDLPARPDELKSQEWQIGTWEGTVKWSMPGMEGDYKMVTTNEWSGQFMKSVSKTDAGGMQIEEIGYLGWDAKKKKYFMYTFTNFAATPRIEWGEEKAGVAVFLSEPWDVMGDTMESRATVTKKSDTEMAFMLEIKRGAEWSKVAEGSFKKKA